MKPAKPSDFHAQATDPAEPWRYILSAGRTGTVFLEQLFAQYAPDVTACHEPAPTRYQMMMGNLRNDFGILDRPTKAWVRRSRAQRAKAARGAYIEINPFLCAVTDALPDPARALRVVHIVREPSDWAQSMTVFKASSRYRGVIDYIPFAKPFPAPRPEGWHRLSQFDRNLWRWVWCNTRILELQGACAHFITIRYEDLFDADHGTRRAAIARIFDAFALDMPGEIDWAMFERRINPAPSEAPGFDHSAVAAITGPLARRLGYGR